jgi:hypothetical protein
MSTNVIATGPKKITSGNLTYFEVRVLGVLIGTFAELATSLGVEIDAITNVVVEEIFDAEANESADAERERVFKATWNGHERYAALTPAGWTPAFDSEDDLRKSWSTGGFGM